MHVAVVLVPNQRADLYVGGARVANNATPPGIFEDTTASMRIGCNGGGPKDFFTGSLDELRIYTRALADSEIAALAH